jgi:hypothetical protein
VQVTLLPAEAPLARANTTAVIKSKVFILTLPSYREFSREVFI